MNKILKLSDNYKLVVKETTDQILNYSCLICLREHNKTDGKIINPIATCTLATIDKQDFLFTAGHVIHENDPEDLGIMIGRHFHVLIGEARYVNPDFSEEYDKIDVAVMKLELSLANILKSRYKFLTINNLEIEHNLIYEEPRYLIVGYPWRKSRPNPIKKTITTKPLVFAGFLAGEDAYKELKLKKETNIILKFTQKKVFDAKTDLRRKSGSPEGISGCGIWLLEKLIYPPNEGPSLKLLGIITSQDKNKKYLKATRIDVINEILIKDFRLNIKHSNFM